MVHALLLAAIVVPPGAAASAFKLLLEHKKVHGQVSARLVRSVAELCGKSEDTIWRWLRDGQPAGRGVFALSDEEVRLLAANGGNVTGMFRDLKKAEMLRASLRQYQRAAKTSLTPAMFGFFEDGDRGWRRGTIHQPVVVERRGQVFHVDHTHLKIWLQMKGRTHWVQPWLTSVIDAKTRLMMGWVVSLQPNQAVVLAALRAAFTGEHGCIPLCAVWDNGAEFLAEAVTVAAQTLVFKAAPIEAYAPWQNGKIERWFGTLKTEFLSKQPFYRSGPRGRNKKLYGPKTGPLFVDEFVERLADWIDEYNRRRVHSQLDGKTPEQAWRDEPTAVRRVDERLLDFMLMREKQQRAISVHGIRHNNRWYYDDELLAYKGDRIDVRFMPYDDSRIWLFDGEEFLAEAIPWEDMPEQRLKQFHTKRAGTLTSARAMLPGRSTNLGKPDEHAPGDEGQDATAAEGDDLPTTLAKRAADAARDADDEEDALETQFDNVNEAID